MKKFTKVVSLLAVSFSLFGCGTNETQKDNDDVHIHTYSSSWSYDDQKHWHDSNCGHLGFASEIADHIFDESGFCSVCGLETPEHFKFFAFNGKTLITSKSSKTPNAIQTP